MMRGGFFMSGVWSLQIATAGPRAQPVGRARHSGDRLEYPQAGYLTA